MKMYDLSILIIVGIVLVSAIVGAVSIKVMGKGNAIEKAEAGIISEETGVPEGVVEEVEEKAVDAVLGTK